MPVFLKRTNNQRPSIAFLFCQNEKDAKLGGDLKQDSETRFIAEVLPHIRDIDRASWQHCLPGEAEDYDYYCACEESRHSAYEILALQVMRGGKTVAVAPAFRLTYRLDTPFQGAMRRISDQITKWAPGLFALKVLALGSPLAERCHLGFSPELDGEERLAAAQALFEAMDAYALRAKIGLLALKDMSEADHAPIAAGLREAGFNRINSLPLAILDLPETEDDYIRSLSPMTRKDLRRKLRGSSAIRIECVRSIEGLEEQLQALYDETRAASGLDYGDLEALPPGYFGAVVKKLDGRACVYLYWIGAELIGFNLLLLQDGKAIDKFIGRRHPQARQHNLYFVSWMENVRFCLKHGYRRLQSGQTAYAVKVRLGSRLEPSIIFFRHRNFCLNLILRFASRFMAFDDMDPDLLALKQKKTR